jgi:hypothetical protein
MPHKMNHKDLALAEGPTDAGACHPHKELPGSTDGFLHETDNLKAQATNRTRNGISAEIS